MRASVQVDLIINRRARAVERRPALIDEMRRIAGQRATVHVTGNAYELQAVARELGSRGTDGVLLAGGDGSLMAGVTALWKAFGPDAMPILSPIPAGTVGTIARNWGISGPPATCLRRYFERPRRLVQHPSLRIVAEHADGRRTRVGFIIGTGLVARFFRHYYARGAPGYSGSARLVARIFVESFVGGPLATDILTPLPCSLIVDGERREPSAWSLVCCSVIRNLGIRMLVNYRAEEDFERPHLVATPMLPRELGPRAPYVLAGKSFGGPGHVDRLVEQFTIEFPGEGPFVLDGELMSASSVEVSAGPVLTIATPTR